MYAMIFRALPGPLWLRIIQALILIAAAAVVLMVYVFPWMSESFSPWTESTIGMMLL